MPPKKLICGFGINDSDSLTHWIIDGKSFHCPIYKMWKGMIQRCYDEKKQSRSPTYKGCTVDPEWKYFSNFKSWVESKNWTGMQLDKDLLIKGNKVYGPNTCCFIPVYINSIFRHLKTTTEHLGVAYAQAKRQKNHYRTFLYRWDGSIAYRAYASCFEAHRIWQLSKYQHTMGLFYRYQSEDFCEDKVLLSLKARAIGVLTDGEKGVPTREF